MTGWMGHGVSCDRMVESTSTGLRNLPGRQDDRMDGSISARCIVRSYGREFGGVVSYQEIEIFLSLQLQRPIFLVIDTAVGVPCTLSVPGKLSHMIQQNSASVAEFFVSCHILRFRYPCTCGTAVSTVPGMYLAVSYEVLRTRPTAVLLREPPVVVVQLGMLLYQYGQVTAVMYVPRRYVCRACWAAGHAPRTTPRPPRPSTCICPVVHLITHTWPPLTYHTRILLLLVGYYSRRVSGRSEVTGACFLSPVVVLAACSPLLISPEGTGNTRTHLLCTSILVCSIKQPDTTERGKRLLSPSMTTSRILVTPSILLGFVEKKEKDTRGSW